MLYTDQQKKRCAENPACLEVKQHFAAPGRTVTDHVNDVLAKLVDTWRKKKSSTHQIEDLKTIERICTTLKQIRLETKTVDSSCEIIPDKWDSEG